MEAYLDNSATTRCSDRVFEVMKQVFLNDYGNPSSLHLKGVEAEKYVLQAKKNIAKTLKVQDKEIYFTSGGTESNNLAIIGTAFANKRAGKHIITTEIEHASVSQTMKYLEEEGFQITYLPVDENGRISLTELELAVTANTILVSIMLVNNEIGTIEPIEEAVRIIKSKNTATLIHVDAIQAYGKMTIHPKKMGIDLLSVSGHKIHGPKGSGFLYIQEKVKIRPIIFGGGQQKSIRSGTENVPAIAGLGEACKESYEAIDEKIKCLYEWKTLFIKGIESIDGVSINGINDDTFAPHIISVSVQDVRSEVLLHSLEEKGIFVSSGSACSSNKPSVSHTLSSIHLKKELLDCTVRFSLCVWTTKEEIEYSIEVLKQLVPNLQRFKRH